MNDEEINTIAATNEGYTDFIKAIGAIRKANGTPSILGINAATEELLALKVDSTGQPLNAPESFNALTKVVSNQLKADASTGSDALVFDPKAMVIGIQNQVTLKMMTDTDYNLKHGTVAFQIYSMIDCAVVRPTHITKITGIKDQATE